MMFVQYEDMVSTKQLKGGLKKDQEGCALSLGLNNEKLKHTIKNGVVKVSHFETLKKISESP